MVVWSHENRLSFAASQVLRSSWRGVSPGANEWGSYPNCGSTGPISAFPISKRVFSPASTFLPLSPSIRSCVQVTARSPNLGWGFVDRIFLTVLGWPFLPLSPFQTQIEIAALQMRPHFQSPRSTCCWPRLAHSCDTLHCPRCVASTFHFSFFYHVQKPSGRSCSSATGQQTPTLVSEASGPTRIGQHLVHTARRMATNHYIRVDSAERPRFLHGTVTS